MKVKIEIDTGNSQYTSDVINILKAIKEQFIEAVDDINKEQVNE